MYLQTYLAHKIEDAMRMKLSKVSLFGRNVGMNFMMKALESKDVRIASSKQTIIQEVRLLASGRE